MRVMKVTPGKDGLVHIVTIRTSKGVYTRLVTKLVPLFSEEEIELGKTVRLLVGSMFAPRPRIHVCLLLRVCLGLLCIWAYVYAWAYVYVWAYVYMWAYIYVWVCMYIWVYTYVCVYVCVAQT